MLLIGVLVIVVLFVFAAMAFTTPNPDEQFGCEDDIPCQECGRCYDDHINALGMNHDYRYPRDIHR